MREVLAGHHVACHLHEVQPGVTRIRLQDRATRFSAGREIQRGRDAISRKPALGRTMKPTLAMG